MENQQIAEARRRKTENIAKAEAEEREKRRTKPYDPREDEKQIGEETEKYCDELCRAVLPNMKGYMGLWNKDTPPTPQGKRNMLYIIAERRAKLEAQMRWLKLEQERHSREA